MVEKNQLKFMDRKHCITFTFITICFIFFGCSSENTTSIAKTYVIVFLDKSSSVDFKSEAKLTSVITNNVNRINNPGDRYLMYYVHRNTLGANSEMDYKIDQQPLQTDAETTIEFQVRTQKWGAEIIEKKRAISDSTLKDVLSANPNKTSQATDLWAIFEKLSEVCEPAAKNHVVIFSDMVESMNGSGRREKLNPSSKKEAEDWAVQDKTTINSTFSVDEAILKNLTLEVVLPYSALSSTFNPNIRYYWETLFKLYGIKVESFR